MRYDPRALHFALLSAASLLVISPLTVFAQAPARKDSAQALGKVVVTGVTGRGSARAASAVDTSVLKQNVPGTSALKVI